MNDKTMNPCFICKEVPTSDILILPHEDGIDRHVIGCRNPDCSKRPMVHVRDRRNLKATIQAWNEMLFDFQDVSEGRVPT
jgi:hypothetical protein